MLPPKNGDNVRDEILGDLGERGVLYDREITGKRPMPPIWPRGRKLSVVSVSQAYRRLRRSGSR
jgi:hypothetical protein